MSRQNKKKRKRKQKKVFSPLLKHTPDKIKREAEDTISLLNLLLLQKQVLEGIKYHTNVITYRNPFPLSEHIQAALQNTEAAVGAGFSHLTSLLLWSGGDPQRLFTVKKIANRQDWIFVSPSNIRKLLPNVSPELAREWQEYVERSRSRTSRNW